jgi:hypothetical protein
VSRARCAWLVALIALQSAGVVLGPASSACAWEPVSGTKQLAPRWSGPMIYRLNEKGSDDLDRNVLLAELHRGMLEWTKPDCASATARYDGLTAELPGTLDEPGADNVIAWRESAWTHGPEAVAVTAPSFISSGSDKPPEIVAATMWLNGEDWTWVSGASNGHQINAFSVFLHEGGHYWGLGHSAVPMSVMNANYSHDLGGLAADDRDGICSLYPLGALKDCGTQPCSAGYDCVDGNCLWNGTGAPPAAHEMDGGCGEIDRCDAGTVRDGAAAAADGCVVDNDCATGDARCVAGRCMRLADPPPAMCLHDSECAADEACKAGMCVATDPAQPIGGQLGSDCVMDSDCASGMCQRSGEVTQCTDFCKADRDCGEAGRCLRDGGQTGLCRPSDPPEKPDASKPGGSDRAAHSSGCSATGASAPTSAWFLIVAFWLRRPARRAARGKRPQFRAAQQRNPSEALEKLRSRS